MNSCGGQCLKRRLTDVLSRSMPRLDCPDGCKAGANPVVCLAPLPHRAAGKLSTRSDHIHCTGLLSRRCHRSPVPGGERRERACGLPAPGFPSSFSFFFGAFFAPSWWSPGASWSFQVPRSRRRDASGRGCGTPVSCILETAVRNCAACGLLSQSTAKRQPDWVDRGEGNARCIIQCQFEGWRER